LKPALTKLPRTPTQKFRLNIKLIGARPEWHEDKPNTAVFPAKAGIQNPPISPFLWIRAFAGMTDGVGF